MPAFVESSHFEPVHFVEGFVDGVLNGTADYQGAPHHFILRSAEPNAAEIYQLTPLSAEVFDAVTETWEIWQRWRETQRAASIEDSSSLAALAQDRERQAELRSVISSWLAAAQPFAFLAEGDFERVAAETAGVAQPLLRVKWSRLAASG